MSAKHLRALLACIACLLTTSAYAVPPTSKTCRRAIIDGEVNSAQSFNQSIGNGLALFLQPIASGWILRIVPASGPRGDHDYAELATPPYNSVSPLSISTDFSFRAQDAVGWNPRRFHFATTAESRQRLSETVKALPLPPASPTPAVQQQLATFLVRTSEGTFRILDARLIPGAADQTPTAGSVASHFASTAHTIQQPASPTPLGKLLWIRFRVTLDFPPSFTIPTSVNSEIYPCPRV